MACGSCQGSTSCGTTSTTTRNNSYALQDIPTKHTGSIKPVPGRPVLCTAMTPRGCGPGSYCRFAWCTGGSTKTLLAGGVTWVPVQVKQKKEGLVVLVVRSGIEDSIPNRILPIRVPGMHSRVPGTRVPGCIATRLPGNPPEQPSRNNLQLEKGERSFPGVAHKTGTLEKKTTPQYWTTTTYRASGTNLRILTGELYRGNWSKQKL
eukprot:2346393-Rhodomonas_salina.2